MHIVTAPWARSQHAGLVPPGSNLTLLMDCCYSGGNQRRLDTDITFRYLPASDAELDAIERARTRYEENQDAYIVSKLREVRDLGEDELKARVPHLVKALQGTRLGDVNNREGNLLMSGCSSTQTSADARIAGSYHGAFTYYLVDAINSLGVAATYRQVATALAQRLTSNHYSQIPQLEGKKENKDIAMFSAFGKPSGPRARTREAGISHVVVDRPAVR